MVAPTARGRRVVGSRRYSPDRLGLRNPSILEAPANRSSLNCSARSRTPGHGASPSRSTRESSSTPVCEEQLLPEILTDLAAPRPTPPVQVARGTALACSTAPVLSRKSRHPALALCVPLSSRRVTSQAGSDHEGRPGGGQLRRGAERAREVARQEVGVRRRAAASGCFGNSRWPRKQARSDRSERKSCEGQAPSRKVSVLL